MLSLVPKLLRLAWPVTLARLGIMGMGLCDVIVVGQMAPATLASQALGWAPTGVMLVSGIGLLNGVPVLAARAIGAGYPQHAGGAWQRGMVVSTLSGLFAAASMWCAGPSMFTLFGIAPDLAEPAAAVSKVLALSVPLHLMYIATAFFVEAIQRPLASTIVMSVANGVNLGLNLLWVPEHGAIGSAWATVGARLFLAAVMVAWVLSQRDAGRYGLRRRIRSPSYREFLGVGGAAALSQAAEAGAFSGMTIIAGRAGGDAVAAYQIVLNVLAVVFMVSLGLSSATTVLTSQAVGRRASEEAARAAWTGLLVTGALMVVVGVLIGLVARPLAAAYTTDLEVVLIVAGLLPLSAAAMAPDGGQAVASAALRAHGDNWFPTASHVVAYALLMPALGLGLGELQGMGVRGLIQAILWSSVFSVSVLMGRLWILTRRGGLQTHPEAATAITD